MDRRESLKSMLLGSMAVGTLESCVTETSPEIIEDKIWAYTYGRTPKGTGLWRKADLQEFLMKPSGSKSPLWRIWFCL